MGWGRATAAGLMATIGAAATAMLIGAAPTPAQAAKFKNCGHMEEPMRQAHKFLVDHFDKIKTFKMAKGRKRDQRIRKRMENRLPNLVIRCQTRACRNKGWYGYARPASHKRFVVCANNIRSANYNDQSEFCMIVSTIAHEFAHIVRMPHGKGHNSGDNGDRVYQFDNFVYQYCLDNYTPASWKEQKTVRGFDPTPD